MWNLAVMGLLICMAGLLACCLRGDAVSRLVALEAGSSLTIVILLALGETFQRSIFADLALTLALLSFGAGLVFARFVERWL